MVNSHALDTLEVTIQLMDSFLLTDQKGFCFDVKKALSLGFKEEDKSLIEKNCD